MFKRVKYEQVISYILTLHIFYCEHLSNIFFLVFIMHSFIPLSSLPSKPWLIHSSTALPPPMHYPGSPTHPPCPRHPPHSPGRPLCRPKVWSRTHVGWDLLRLPSDAAAALLLLLLPTPGDWDEGTDQACLQVQWLYVSLISIGGQVAKGWKLITEYVARYSNFNWNMSWQYLPKYHDSWLVFTFFWVSGKFICTGHYISVFMLSQCCSHFLGVLSWSLSWCRRR